MTADDARRALASGGIDARTVEAIGDGWSSWTFEVDGEWIARFPRDDEVAVRVERENRLLPVLAEHVTFGVPVPEHLGRRRGRSFQVYRKLPGTPLTPDTADAATLAALLREVHDFPADRARQLLGPAGTAGIIEGDTVEHWREAYRSLWVREVEPRVIPILPPPLAATVADEYGVFLADEMRFTPTLIHNDLGLEHILATEDGRLSLIDFEYAAVGDPAYDFIGLWIGLGLDRMREVLAAYGVVDEGWRLDPGWPGRIRFYRWMGSVWAILHGLDTHNAELVAGATAELGRRIAGRHRVCGALIRDDQVLMVHQEGRFWTLPGGGIDPGESPEMALEREVFEEVGMRARVRDLLYRTTYSFGIESCYVLDCDGEPCATEDPDVTGAAWFPLEGVADDPQVARVLAELATRDSVRKA